MGSRRIRAERLGEKLLAVRLRLGYNQTEMADMLSNDSITILRQDVYKYEKNERDPPLPIVLRYARLAQIPMEILADDSKDLP